jgi:hypothetical protein
MHLRMKTDMGPKSLVLERSTFCVARTRVTAVQSEEYSLPGDETNDCPAASPIHPFTSLSVTERTETLSRKPSPTHRTAVKFVLPSPVPGLATVTDVVLQGTRPEPTELVSASPEPMKTNNNGMIELSTHATQPTDIYCVPPNKPVKPLASYFDRFLETARVASETSLHEQSKRPCHRKPLRPIQFG